MAIKRWNANTSTWELVGTPGTVTPAAIGAASLANANTFSSNQRINGNLGIGTAATAGRLALQSAGDRQIDLLGQDGNTYAYIGTTGGIGSAPANSLKIRSDAGGIIFGYQGFEQARIDTSGNIGIGTSSPQGKLHVYTGASGNNYSQHTVTQRIESNGDAGLGIHTPVANNAVINHATPLDGGSASIIFNGQSRYMSFHTVNGTERMRIDASGNVGIGVTNPGYKLHVEASGTNYILSRNSAAGSGIAGFICQNSGDTRGMHINGSTLHLYDYSAGAARLSIDGSGNVLIGYASSNGSYKLQINSQIFATSSSIATSDGRYKENILPITSGLDIIDSLNPVSFDWKEHPVHNFVPGKTVGFIAQEVKEALKDYEWVDNIIKTNNMEAVLDEDGNEITPAEEFLGIAESNIIPLLVAAVKELRAEVNTLKAQVNN